MSGCSGFVDPGETHPCAEGNGREGQGQRRCGPKSGGGWGVGSGWLLAAWVLEDKAPDLHLRTPRRKGL